MSKKNKNITSEALLEMNSLKEAIKEESKNTLRTMLGEAVKDVLRESIEDEEEDDYEVVEESTEDKENNKDTDSKKSGEVDEDIDDEQMSQTQNTMPQDNAEQAQVADTQEAPIEGEGENAQDDWSNYSQYQTGDENTYDLTGEEDYNQIVKVYKLMQDSDQVVIRQDGNTIQLTDDGTGAEYVIDLGSDNEESQGEEMEMSESIIKENDDDIAGFPDEEDEDNDEFEFDFTDDEDEEEPRFNESKKAKKVMKENKQLVFEVDLGYTDNYQSKDPIQGLSNTEPSKTGKSWEKGVPTGTEKPWAGKTKDKGEPFEKTVNEGDIDECGAACENNEDIVDESTTNSIRGQRDMGTKKHISANRKEYGPKVKHHISSEGDYNEVVESYKKEIAKLKKINEAYKKENSKLKTAAKDLAKNIQESYVVNTNLAKITRLFTENTVSQKEKVDIVNRFATEAKTVEQSQALYESINKQLTKNNKNLTLENTGAMKTVEPNKQLNEVKKSKGLMETLDLIKRMGNL